MNNELKYHGKTLNEMSDNELNQQYVLNRQRIIGNSALSSIVDDYELQLPIVIKNYNKRTKDRRLNRLSMQ